MLAIWNVDAGTGLVRPTHKWRQEPRASLRHPKPKDTKDTLKAGRLYLQDGEMFIWALPEVHLICWQFSYCDDLQG